MLGGSPTDVLGQAVTSRLGGTADEPRLSRDAIFTVLSNRRRRLVIHYLKRQEGTVSVREMARQLALWENDVSEAEVTYKQRKRVYTSLHQTHLPKLHDVGIVDYDKDRGTVALAAHARELDIYLEVVHRDDVPWSVFYLGLAAVSAVFVVGALLDLFPFTLVPDLGYAVGVTLLFALSAGAHTLYSRRMRLGGAREPLASPDDE